MATLIYTGEGCVAWSSMPFSEASLQSEYPWTTKCDWVATKSDAWSSFFERPDISSSSHPPSLVLCTKYTALLFDASINTTHENLVDQVSLQDFLLSLCPIARCAVFRCLPELFSWCSSPLKVYWAYFKVTFWHRQLVLRTESPVLGTLVGTL